MKQLAGKLLLLVASTALVWIAGEIVLRQMVGDSDDVPLHTATVDPFVPRLHPDTIARRHGVEVRTNALGLRNGPVRVPKPPGATRVLCIGDSYTFGTGVAQEETLPARLERELGVEVVNMGIEGANAYDNEARLRHIGLGLDPDLVVLCYLFNDVYRMERGRDWMAARVRNPEAARRAHGESRHRSLVVDYLRSRLAAIWRRFDRDAGRLGVWNDQYRDGVPAWEETQRSLLAMRDACRASGAGFVIAVMPAFAHFSDEAYPLPDYRRTMLDFGAAHGVSVVDLHEPFWGGSGRRYWISPLDPHPDAGACARMARALAPALRAGARPARPAD